MSDWLQPLFTAIAKGNPDKTRQVGIGLLAVVLADIHDLNHQAKLIRAFAARYGVELED